MTMKRKSTTLKATSTKINRKATTTATPIAKTMMVIRRKMKQLTIHRNPIRHVRTVVGEITYLKNADINKANVIVVVKLPIWHPYAEERKK